MNVLFHPIPTELEGQPTEWVVIGMDITGFSYDGDEDNEAIDRTNWSVVLGELDADCENVWSVEWSGWSDGMRSGSTRTHTNPFEDVEDGASDGEWWIGDAGDFGFDTTPYRPPNNPLPYRDSDTVLIIKVGTDTYDAIMGLVERLDDYPLLDEEGYCELEMEAWERCLENYVIHDTARESARIVIDTLRDDDDSTYTYLGVDVDEAEDMLADVLETHSREWLQSAHENGEYHGFTGEYDCSVFDNAVSNWCIAVNMSLAVLTKGLRGWNAAGMGVVPLPFPELVH